jgi:hypothetical protein
MDVSAVVALFTKASDLQQFGHEARAYEYLARALAAAQALGAADCLIVATLQLYQADMLRMAALSAKKRGTPPTAQRYVPIVTLYLAASATLQRRSAAGTLLVGAFRAAEETWDRLISEHTAVRHGNSAAHALAATLAQLVGYKAFLSAACIGAHFVCATMTGMLPMSNAQLRECVALMADAVELFMLPRIAETEVALTFEGQLVDNMQPVVGFPQMLAPYGAAGARLLASWRRLEQSGVLQRRNIDVALKNFAQELADFSSASAAAGAAPGLRACALAACGAREAHPAHFKSCAACRVPAYCCKAHQEADWPSHKAACKAARKAAAAAAQLECGGRAADF